MEIGRLSGELNNRFASYKAYMTVFVTIFLAGGSLLIPIQAYASESEVDRETIIESLKPKPQAKTRSLRNLTVEKSEPPSISLTIQFQFDSAEVSEKSRNQLDVLADAMRSNELLEYSFKIEGHTDAKGSSTYNQKLSERRAASVRDILYAKGISRERLETLGKGSSELVNATDPFAAENRRVKFITVDN